ncbi:hypothetical protein NMY22_g15200 [Coprinellus aureogranulatus]|nr:hypothetical protein NMY22_g15200 [Coprinellus aureogranulatus]
MKAFCAFLLLLSSLLLTLAARMEGFDGSNLQRRTYPGAETSEDAFSDYTPAELKRNALLKRLGLPVEPPKARRGGGVGFDYMARPFDSSRGSDLCVLSPYIAAICQILTFSLVFPPYSPSLAPCMSLAQIRFERVHWRTQGFSRRSTHGISRLS